MAAPSRPGLQVRGVRAGLGFGQREGGQLFPPGQVGQPAALLVLGAEEHDGFGADRTMYIENAGGTGAVVSNLLHEDGKREMIEPRSLVRIRHQDAEQAQLGGLLNQVTRELAAVIDGVGAGLDLALGEITNEFPDLLLFRTEREIHLGCADDGGLALRHPGADGGRAVAAATLAERIGEVHPDASTRSADWMPDRERAAIDIDPLLVQAEEVHGGAGDRSEGLVDLE